MSAPPVAYVAKLDSSGNVSWQKMFGETQRAKSIRQTSDGGYVVAGYSSMQTGASPSKQCYILKLNSSGNPSWEKNYGGGGDDYAESIVQTGIGGYMVAGSSPSTEIPAVTNNGGKDCYIIKLD
jgi:hypothetical protein